MLDAADVAHRAGLHLRQKGSRFWTCCPLHGEKTPSMCFFPDGKFHCFGCGLHGDAADLYAALHGVPLAEALRVCKGDYKPDPTRRKIEDLRERVERWFSEQWSLTCNKKHLALESMLHMEHSGQAPPDNDAYWHAIEQLSHAEDRLSHLDSVKDDPVGKTMLYTEAMSDKQRTRTAGMESRCPA